MLLTQHVAMSQPLSVIEQNQQPVDLYPPLSSSPEQIEGVQKAQNVEALDKYLQMAEDHKNCVKSTKPVNARNIPGALHKDSLTVPK